MMPDLDGITTNVDMRDLIRDIHVRVVYTHMFEVNLRLRLASALIWLAVKVGGFGGVHIRTMDRDE